MTTAPFHEVVAAIESVDLDAPWAEVASDLRLVLPRRRPLPPGTGDLPQRRYASGISAGLGLDIGPAMLFVGPEQLATWGVSEDDAFDRAEANVRQRARSRPAWPLICEPIVDVATISFHSREGWASSLLLMPEELCRVIGERAGLVLAPMRDLLLWMPIDTDAAFAAWVLEELAQADMNALDLPVLTFIDGQLAMAVPAEPMATHGRAH